MGPARRGGGFTLVELMITLAVAVVLLTIAVPSFRYIMLSNRLTTAANDFVAALNTARMAAIARNASAQLCSDSASKNTSDTLGAGCGAQAGAVYVATGSTATRVRDAVTGIASPIKLNGNVAAIRFGSEGVGHVAGGTDTNPVIADLCTSAISSNNHRIITMAAGSIVTTTTSTGTCS